MKTDPLIGRYLRGADLLAYALAEIPTELATRRVEPGTWSLAELAAHMADSDLVGAERMKRVIAEDGPTLLAYDETAWIARLDPHNLPIAEAVELFSVNRRYMTRILRGVSEADFARTGMHTERGRETLADLVAGYVGHLDHHLRFAYAKRGALGIFLAPHYSQD